MKCARCHKEMKRKQDASGAWFWECPRCGRTIGRTAEAVAAAPDPAFDLTGVNIETTDDGETA